MTNRGSTLNERIDQHLNALRNTLTATPQAASYHSWMFPATVKAMWKVLITSSAS